MLDLYIYKYVAIYMYEFIHQYIFANARQWKKNGVSLT